MRNLLKLESLKCLAHVLRHFSFKFLFVVNFASVIFYYDKKLFTRKLPCNCLCETDIWRDKRKLLYWDGFVTSRNSQLCVIAFTFKCSQCLMSLVFDSTTWQSILFLKKIWLPWNKPKPLLGLYIIDVKRFKIAWNVKKCNCAHRHTMYQCLVYTFLMWYVLK